MASAPEKASSAPRGAKLNEILSRGKLIAQQKKACAEAEARGEVYDYPLDTLLLHDGSCDLTLQDLMNNQQISKTKAIKVMKKFRAEAESAAKEAEASSLKGGAVLPEAAASKKSPKSRGSSEASQALALQPDDAAKVETKKGNAKEMKLDIAKPSKKTKKTDDAADDEGKLEGKPVKKSKASPLDACEDGCEKAAPKVKKSRASIDEDGTVMEKNPPAEEKPKKKKKMSDGENPTRKRKTSDEADLAATLPDTLVDPVADEGLVSSGAEKKKKEKKDKNKAIIANRQEIQDLIDEIEEQIDEVAPKVSRRTRGKTTPAEASAPGDQKPARPEGAVAHREDPPKPTRACSQDRQPDPTESQLESQGRTWTLACSPTPGKYFPSL